MNVTLPSLARRTLTCRQPRRRRRRHLRKSLISALSSVPISPSLSPPRTWFGLSLAFGRSTTKAANQPLVRTNADTGKKAIYFHPGRVENIVGMSPEDTHKLLEELLERALKPEFIYNHQWKLGDMLIWDNRSALHRANYDYDVTDMTQQRLMYRMLVKGERPV